MIKMVTKENQCVNCGKTCLGSSCPNRNVTVFYCDRCHDEAGHLYDYDGEQLCEECLMMSVPIVEG